MEPREQYLARHVLVSALRELIELGGPVSEERVREWADELESRSSKALEHLRESLETARKACEEETGVVYMRHDHIYWRLVPTLVQDEREGPLVKLEWGWNRNQITTTGRDAFDLAAAILGFFTGEDGELRVPESPKRSEEPEVSPSFDKFMEVATEFMETTGDKSGCSMVEVTFWVRAGRPKPVVPHAYVEYPEDGVAVCEVCGHFYEIGSGEITRACPLEPLVDGPWASVHIKDPRRTPHLREAQRLDRLAATMKLAKATDGELAPFLEALDRAKSALGVEDATRFEREHVGLEDGP